jgi:FixJ family two-component response regulator
MTITNAPVQTAPTLAQATPIVFVVDDDAATRESLESLISASGWRPETFASAQAFLSRPRAIAPSCLVLDVTLPDLNGLDLQERISADRHDLPIIFITGHGDVPMTVKAMKAGAIEFLTKPFSSQVLLSAIGHAIDYSHTALRHALELQSLQERYASLTGRECEVMGLVVQGLLNKQIGSELGITELTVKAHRGNLMRKRKARSLAGLVSMAANLHLVPTILRGHGVERSLSAGAH